MVETVEEFLEHHGVKGQKWGIRNEPKPTIKVSEKPWSSYTSADYTVEQWRNACLIHLEEGATSKNKHKLPVKTPDGVVNRHGVFAAAAALGGARTPLKASSEQKASAARKLISFYRKMGAKPPPSLLAYGHSMDVGNFLEHHGIKEDSVRVGGKFVKHILDKP